MSVVSRQPRQYVPGLPCVEMTAPLGMVISADLSLDLNVWRMNWANSTGGTTNDPSAIVPRLNFVTCFPVEITGSHPMPFQLVPSPPFQSCQRFNCLELQVLTLRGTRLLEKVGFSCPKIGRETYRSFTFRPVVGSDGASGSCEGACYNELGNPIEAEKVE